VSLLISARKIAHQVDCSTDLEGACHRPRSICAIDTSSLNEIRKHIAAADTPEQQLVLRKRDPLRAFPFNKRVGDGSHTQCPRNRPRRWAPARSADRNCNRVLCRPAVRGSPSHLDCFGPWSCENDFRPPQRPSDGFMVAQSSCFPAAVFSMIGGELHPGNLWGPQNRLLSRLACPRAAAPTL
jgi:hypothetical protein